MTPRDDRNFAGGRLMRATDLAPGASRVAMPKPWRVHSPSPDSNVELRDCVVAGTVRSFDWEGSAPLSLKFVFEGEALFESGGSAHRVDSSAFLALNAGSSYRVRVGPPAGADALSVFFSQAFAESVLREIGRSARQKLDDPFGPGVPSGGVFERLYPDAGGLALARRLKNGLPLLKYDPMWLEEHARALLVLLFEAQAEARREATAIQAARSATREELYRRLYLARDYAEAKLADPLTLDELAFVACLSTNYFLRTFRELFGTSPHQFLIEMRLQKAQRLLVETDLTVGDVCLRVGFQSLGSFSWLFKRRIGVSPDAYRRAARSVAPPL
ncbi:MAG: helix-turn-helix transcriptional regulator [Fimbriimonadaceae bacterium]|nr:helix-turn-helix transcriptional regulator [Fimbriimonadaceae bacterium]